MNKDSNVSGIENLKRLFPFESKFFSVGKLKLHYIDEGKGPLIVFMHACPMWSFFYRNLIRELSVNHRVISIDQLGFGLSDKPQDYDNHIESHIDHFERFAQTLSLTDMTLVMHGRGTVIGLGYAVKNPNNVRAFITLNAMPFSGFSLPWRLLPCRVNKWLGTKIIMGLAVFQWDTKILPPDIAAAYEYPLHQKEGKVAILRFVEDLPIVPEDDSSQSMFEIEAGLRLLRDLPSCIIWGMKDWLYRKRNLKRWTQYFPNAEVHKLKNGGRYLTEDSPKELQDIITNFLAKNNL